MPKYSWEHAKNFLKSVAEGKGIAKSFDCRLLVVFDEAEYPEKSWVVFSRLEYVWPD